MSRMMATMEPLVRQAIAEMYAIHFPEAELGAIDAFFATLSGVAYARQSYLMTSDPRMAAAMRKLSDERLTSEQVAALETAAASATADLPPQRNLADLTSNQRKALAQMLGIAVEDLEYTLPDAAP